MVGVEYILLVNTGVSSVALLVLLFLSIKKSHKPEKKKEYISSDMQKIKEQIADE